MTTNNWSLLFAFWFLKDRWCLYLFDKMKKFAINYSRTFPDHRVAPDFRFNREIMSGPATYFRVQTPWFSFWSKDSTQQESNIFTSGFASSPQLHLESSVSPNTTTTTPRLPISPRDPSPDTSNSLPNQICDPIPTRRLWSLRQHPPEIRRRGGRNQGPALGHLIIKDNTLHHYNFMYVVFKAVLLLLLFVCTQEKAVRFD